MVRRHREGVFAAAVIAAYLLAAVWAKEVSLPGPVLIWFPPAGVAIAALFLRPRLLPALLVAEAFSTVAIMGQADGFGLAGLAVNTVGIVGAYALGAEAMRRLGLDPRLRRAEDMLVLGFGALVVGGAGATLVGIPVQATVGLIEWDEALRQAAYFWIGDVVGAACVTPIILLAGHALLSDQRLQLADAPITRFKALRVIELAVPAVAAVWLMSVGDTPLRFTYLAFVPVVLIAVRHGVVSAAVSTAVLGAVMTAGAHALDTEALDRSDFQLLMLVLTMTGLLTGALVSARHDLLTEHQRLNEILEATPDLVATAAADGTIRYLNPVGRKLLGADPATVASAHAFDFFPDELAVGLMREAMRSAVRSGTWSGETTLRRSDGHLVPVSQVLIAHQHPGDDAVTFSTVCRDMTDQRRVEDQLRRAALYDDATGLPNRALLAEQLALLAEGAERDRTVAVVFADLDHIDRVNETHGFAAGDAVVATVASRLAELVKAPNLTARYGGAQFVVVLTDVDDELDASLFANRLLACVAEPISIDGRELQVTASAGIALAEARLCGPDTVRSAEIALHRAKEAGGGRVTLHDDGLEERAQRRVEIEADLQAALADGSWWLAYQPIVEPASRRIVGAEALLRWNHPERGPVSPYELIRLAEHSGSIVALGREIFRRACEDGCVWHQRGHRIRINVNVSPRQLREPDFARDVREVVTSTGIDPELVVLELTETMLTSDEHGEIAALREIRDLGCKIAVDDFGTGYSALANLRDLPIDIVKLDLSFITELCTSPRAAALVDAVIRLADALDLTVVAEGVEQEDQLAALVELRCHEVQGWALGHPVAPGLLSDLLAEVSDDSATRRSI